MLTFRSVTVTVEYEESYVASNWTINATSVEAGSPIPITISSAGNGYTHSFKAVFGSYSATASAGDGVKSVSIKTSTSWLNAIPNDVSGVCTVTMTTYKDGVAVDESSKTVLITAPAGAAPTLTVQVERVLTVGGVTYPDITGGYVQYKSAVKCTIKSAQASAGSSIATYSINVGGRTEAAFNGTGTTLTSALLPVSGQVVITFRATDTRGRTGQTTKTIQVEEYSPPKPTNFEVYRVDDDGQPAANGTKARYSFNPVYTSLGGKNSCTASISCAGSTANNIANAGWIVPGAVKLLDVLTSYEVQLTLTDIYGDVVYVTRIPSINFAMHFSADGTSTWVGEACQHSNAFGVAATRNVYFYGQELKELIKSLIPEAPKPDPLAAYPVGSIYMSVNSTNPQDIFGGTWTQLKDRFLLGAGSTYKAGNTGGAATVTLTVDQMPSHSHTLQMLYTAAGGSAAWVADNVEGKWDWIEGRIGSTGGGKAHENLPPYLTVYMWQRTA